MQAVIIKTHMIEQMKFYCKEKCMIDSEKNLNTNDFYTEFEDQYKKCTKECEQKIRKYYYFK